MNLTLSPGDKITITLNGSSVTFDSISADLREGRIHHAAPVAGKAVSLVNNEDGTLLLCATVAGDYNGDGAVTADDSSIGLGLQVKTGPDFAHRIEL